MTSPFPNSYWLEPGRILCGEYPRDFDDLEDHEGMTAILQSGVRVFIDLTEEGELKPYREIADKTVTDLGIDPADLEFFRYPIRDVSVPKNTQEMRAILRTIRMARHRQRTVYLHCWGGRGRTGTVAGCLLSDLFGLAGEDALVTLADRWLGCAKSEYSESPETDEQRGFVRSFSPVPPPITSQVRAAILGAAVADALGVPVEFAGRARRKEDPVTDMRGYGTHHQPLGTWSDDTSMILATVEALAENGDYSPGAIMEHFVGWLHEGRYTPHGKVFDVGGATRSGIIKYQAERNPATSGSDHESANGNGSLMRILPIALAYGDDPNLIQLAFEVSALTHSHIRSQFCCAFYCLVISELRHRSSLQEAVLFAHDVLTDQLDLPPKESEMLARLHPDHLFARREEEIHSSGHVINTLEAALWVNHQHDNYRDAVLHAVNLGDDTDTTASVAGGLASLLHGEEGIPQEWLEVLVKRESLIDLAERFGDFCIKTAGDSLIRESRV